MSKKYKISIVLPVHNGIKYVDEFIRSVTTINNNNFELVISENCSTDGTREYLREIAQKYNFIKYFETETLLSQPDNWTNGILKTTGDWVILIGVDDALTPNFFYSAEKLIKIAEKKRLNIIKTNRIYYFWDDEITKKIYDNCHYSYFSRNRIIERKTKDALYNGLYMGQFVDMPQMYTTSLFRRELIEKIKSISKNGKLIPYNSPDAYLGAAACFFEDKYLYAEIPIAWVGTSSSSQGYRDSQERKITNIDISLKDYKEFTVTTYKTINATELLVGGALDIVQKNAGHIKYDYDKLRLVKNVAYKKINQKDESSFFVDDLLRAWDIKKSDITYKPYREKNPIILLIKKFFLKLFYSSIHFYASYDDSKTCNWKYSQVNKLI